MLTVVFALCAALAAYHCIGYPVLVRAWARSRLRRRPGTAYPHPSTKQDGDLPSLTVIVPAYNEERFIADKIKNLSELEYSPSRLTFVLAFDGCTDRTVAIAENAIRHLAPSRFQLRVHSQNRGKVHILNEEIARATTDLVALTDVSAMLQKDALLAVAVHFRSEDVGLVCPAYRLMRPTDRGETLYWDYQTAIKYAESVVASPIGPHGAFYAFRRRLWQPLEPDTINDDFVLPMRMLMKGCRAVYDPSVVAGELEPGTAQQDFRRRMRIAAGNLQQLIRLRGLASPRHGALAFLFLSSKGLRALLPLLCLVAFISSVLLATHGSMFFFWVVSAESIALALAILTGITTTPLWKPLSSVGYVVRGMCASILGTLMLICKPERTPSKLTRQAR